MAWHYKLRKITILIMKNKKMQQNKEFKKLENVSKNSNKKLLAKSLTIGIGGVAIATFLPLLLDLTADSIDWKKERLMSHVSQSDEKYLRLINKYFAIAKEKYKQFSLSTHFDVKSFEVNQKNMSVKASGQLISRFGERGYQSRPVLYGLAFEWVAGKLLLKEFVKLSKEEEEQYAQPNK
jgi:hypothetical protein